MNLDLKKFKKLSSNDKETVLEHDMGHKITIAHRALSPAMRQQLHRMKAPEGEQMMAEGGMPETQASVMPSEEESIMQMATQPAQPMQAPVAPMQPPPQQAVLPSSAIENVQPAEKTPEQVVNGPKQEMPKAPDELGYGNYEKHYEKGVAEQEKGIQMQAQAEQMKAEKEQQAIKEAQETEKELAASTVSKLNQYEEDHKHFEDDVKNQKINPNRFYSNMSTGQKIATGIGMLLGGLGAVSSPDGSNPVMGMIQKQIDADIEAQKSELGKKQNLLSANMHHFGNMKDAIAMTRAQNLDMLKLKLQDAAARASTPQAKAIAMQQIGKLEQESGAIRQKIAMKRTAADFLNSNGQNDAKVDHTLNLLEASGDPELKGMAKDARERRVPGYGIANAPITPAVREKIIAGKNLQELIGRVRQFAKEHAYSSSGWDPNRIAEGEQLTAQLMDAYRTAKNQGVFKESEKEFDKAIIPQNPTSLFHSIVNGTDKRYENLEQLFHREHNNLLRGYGLKRNTAPLNVMPPKI